MVVRVEKKPTLRTLRARSRKYNKMRWEQFKLRRNRIQSHQAFAKMPFGFIWQNFTGRPVNPQSCLNVTAQWKANLVK